ncbi:MAG: hypothetical protein SNJ59_08370 [Aggregatilineales bacterium]
METPLTILYTSRLRGDLALLPRLYTFLRALREQHVDRSLLLDLGESCDPSVWPCHLTGGRSTLIALDAMGYDAANVEGVLAPELREALLPSVRLALVDRDHPWPCGEWTVCVGVMPTPHINLMPAGCVSIEGEGVRLAAVEAGQVGSVALWRSSGGVTVTAVQVLDLPPKTPPDSTIAGVVDFITAEARYLQKRRDRPAGGATRP